MTDEEKIGQLFIDFLFFFEEKHNRNQFTNKELLEKYMSSSIYRGGTSEQVQDLINSLQKDTKIPLLVQQTVMHSRMVQ